MGGNSSAKIHYNRGKQSLKWVKRDRYKIKVNNLNWRQDRKNKISQTHAREKMWNRRGYNDSRMTHKMAMEGHA